MLYELEDLKVDLLQEGHEADHGLPAPLREHGIWLLNQMVSEL